MFPLIYKIQFGNCSLFCRPYSESLKKPSANLSNSNVNGVNKGSDSPGRVANDQYSSKGETDTTFTTYDPSALESPYENESFFDGMIRSSHGDALKGSARNYSDNDIDTETDDHSEISNAGNDSSTSKEEESSFFELFKQYLIHGNLNVETKDRHGNLREPHPDFGSFFRYHIKSWVYFISIYLYLVPYVDKDTYKMIRRWSRLVFPVTFMDIVRFYFLGIDDRVYFKKIDCSVSSTKYRQIRGKKSKPFQLKRFIFGDKGRDLIKSDYDDDFFPKFRIDTQTFKPARAYEEGEEFNVFAVLGRMIKESQEKLETEQPLEIPEFDQPDVSRSPFAHYRSVENFFLRLLIDIVYLFGSLIVLFIRFFFKTLRKLISYFFRKFLKYMDYFFCELFFYLTWFYTIFYRLYRLYIFYWVIPVTEWTREFVGRCLIYYLLSKTSFSYRFFYLLPFTVYIIFIRLCDIIENIIVFTYWVFFPKILTVYFINSYLSLRIFVQIVLMFLHFVAVDSDPFRKIPRGFKNFIKYLKRIPPHLLMLWWRAKYFFKEPLLLNAGYIPNFKLLTAGRSWVPPKPIDPEILAEMAFLEFRWKYTYEIMHAIRVKTGILLLLPEFQDNPEGNLAHDIRLEKIERDSYVIKEVPQLVTSSYTDQLHHYGSDIGISCTGGIQENYFLYTGSRWFPSHYGQFTYLKPRVRKELLIEHGHIGHVYSNGMRFLGIFPYVHKYDSFWIHRDLVLNDKYDRPNHSLMANLLAITKVNDRYLEVMHRQINGSVNINIQSLLTNVNSHLIRPLRPHYQPYIHNLQSYIDFQFSRYYGPLYKDLKSVYYEHKEQAPIYFNALSSYFKKKSSSIYNHFRIIGNSVLIPAYFFLKNSFNSLDLNVKLIQYLSNPYLKPLRDLSFSFYKFSSPYYVLFQSHLKSYYNQFFGPYYLNLKDHIIPSCYYHMRYEIIPYYYNHMKYGVLPYYSNQIFVYLNRRQIDEIWNVLSSRKYDRSRILNDSNISSITRSFFNDLNIIKGYSYDLFYLYLLLCGETPHCNLCNSKLYNSELLQPRRRNNILSENSASFYNRFGYVIEKPFYDKNKKCLQLHIPPSSSRNVPNFEKDLRDDFTLGDFSGIRFGFDSHLYKHRFHRLKDKNYAESYIFNRKNDSFTGTKVQLLFLFFKEHIPAFKPYFVTSSDYLFYFLMTFYFFFVLYYCYQYQIYLEFFRITSGFFNGIFYEMWDWSDLPTGNELFSESYIYGICYFVYTMLHFILIPFFFFRFRKRWHRNRFSQTSPGVVNRTVCRYTFFIKLSDGFKTIFFVGFRWITNWYFLMWSYFFMIIICFYFFAIYACI